MNHDPRHRRSVILAAAVLVPLLVIFMVGLALAGSAGRLP